jgi:hypothetical protein
MVPRAGAFVHPQTRNKEEEEVMASNTPKKNQTDQTTADQKLIDGLTKHAATLSSIVIAGASTTTANIEAKLQARIAAIKTVQTTKATWQAAIVAQRTEQATTKTFVSGVKQALLVAFAGQVDALADFGLTARKVRVLTPEDKVAAAAKRLATRTARHTLGSKQKAAIKGTVAPTTPVTAAPPAATPTATPAAPSAASPTPTPVAPQPTAPAAPASPVAAPTTTPTPAHGV